MHSLKSSKAKNSQYKSNKKNSEPDLLKEAEKEVGSILGKLKGKLINLSDDTNKKKKNQLFDKNVLEVKRKLEYRPPYTFADDKISKRKLKGTGDKAPIQTIKKDLKIPPVVNASIKKSSVCNKRVSLVVPAKVVQNKSVTRRKSSLGSIKSTKSIKSVSIRKSNKSLASSKPSWYVDNTYHLVVDNASQKKSTTNANNAFPQYLKDIQSARMTPLQKLQQIAVQAIKNRKTFTVVEGYYSVRKALIRRGWVEKLWLTPRDNRVLRQLNSLSIYELLKGIYDENIGSMCQRVIMSKLLRNHQVDFYWSYNNDIFKIAANSNKPVITNRFKRGIFNYTSKGGLCELLKKAHWYQKPGVSFMRHPRAYILNGKGDPNEFIYDFKITAAQSLLKWVVLTGTNKNSKLISKAGKIPLSMFNFAIDECAKFVKKARHEDIDYEIKSALGFEWDRFLEYFYKTVHVTNHFKSNGTDTEEGIVKKAQFMLETIEPYHPELKMDGYMNIWILKPCSGCRGIGIHICRTLKYIMQVLGTNKSTRYVCQKYIEKPLLIYNTKFDIRQWFLISSTIPLTVWIYDECYLRFSSQTYNLRKLHESIHLTNNAIQCRYRNAIRDVALPMCNMWDLQQFKTYLSGIGHPDAFEKIIFPGMKECITSAVLVNQDHIEGRKNSFELYGADFILTEDFAPWLLEINSRPALYSSTPVTAKMCHQVLEDLIKVVIDHAKDKEASTGHFRLLYRQYVPSMPYVDTENLKLLGTPLNKNYFMSIGNINEIKEKITNTEKVDQTKSSKISEISANMKQTLEKLLVLIQKERERRERRSRGISASVQALKVTEKKDSATEYFIPVKTKSTGFYSLMDSSYSEGSLTELEKDIETFKDSLESIDNNDSRACFDQHDVDLLDTATNEMSEEKTETKSQELIKVVASILQTVMERVPIEME